MITSNQAAHVSYDWKRSNGSQTGIQTVSVGAGQTFDVTDSLNAPSDTYSGSDTLQIGSPVSTSKSIPIVVSCVNSHVTSITVSGVALSSIPTFCSTTSPQAITGSATIQVVASSTAPVTLTWQTSQNTSQTPGTPITGGGGSQALSGQTTYSVPISVSFGSFPQPGAGCTTTYFVVQATATGTDGSPLSNSSSYVYLIT